MSAEDENKAADAALGDPHQSNTVALAVLGDPHQLNTVALAASGDRGPLTRETANVVGVIVQKYLKNTALAKDIQRQLLFGEAHIIFCIYNLLQKLGKRLTPTDGREIAEYVLTYLKFKHGYLRYSYVLELN